MQGERIHCLGVGGIGVSAVAGLCAAMGAEVNGCDVKENEQIRALRRQGCSCFIGHSADHVEGATAVVYSSAIPREHPELQAARARGIPLYTRAQMLARLLEGKQTVGVAGAHGKTTTTWLAAHLLITAGLQPSVMVGGKVSDLGGNWRFGTGGHFVTEVDESDGSLLEFHPTYSIITNVDREHLDHYRDFDHIRETFAAYIGQTQPEGCVIGCADDPCVCDLLRRWPSEKLSYSVEERPAASSSQDEAIPDFTARRVRLEPHHSEFEVEYRRQSLGSLILSLPGRHNVQNALAVTALAHRLGISFEELRRAFASTSGVGRRLQRKGLCAGVTVIDDYAHHPREVSATLQAARRMATGRLIGVFQPHRYSRTRLLCNEFGNVFDELDHLLLAPVYAASETPIEGVGSELIGDAIRQSGRVACELGTDLPAITERLRRLVQPGDTVITLGAGDVYQVGEQLLLELEETQDAAVPAR